MSRPRNAVVVCASQQALGEAAAQPQLLPANGWGHFAQQKRGELHLGDAAGQAFLALVQQRAGGRAQQ